MAVRKIETLIEIDGEKKFRDELRAVDSALKTLKSELSVVSSEFRGQENSLAALTAKQKVLRQQYDQQAEKVKSLNRAYEEMRAAYSENSTKTDKYKQSLNSATVALNSIDDELRQNEKYMDEARKSADGCATSIDRYGKETERAKEKTSKLNAIFTGAFWANVASQVVSRLTSALVSLGKRSIDLASDLNEVQNVVDTTFGDNASEIDGWAKAASESFGLSELAAKQYASTLGAMLKSQGVYGDELITFSETLAGLTGDLASFYNLDIESAYEKIRQGVAGETEGLKALGINLSQANIMQTQYAQSLNKTWAAMTPAEQATARYNAILELASDSIGDFSRTSDEYANQTRVLSLEWDTLVGTIGEKLLPVAAAGVGALTDLLGGAESVTDQMRELQKGIADTVSVQNAIDNYHDLSVQLTSGAVSAGQVKEKTDELEAAKQALIDVSGGVITALDLENGSFDNQVAVLEGANNAQRDYLKYKLTAQLLENGGVEATKKAADATASYANWQEQANRVMDEYNEKLARSAEQGDVPEASLNTARESVEYFQSKVAEASETLAEVKQNAAEAENALCFLVNNGMMTVEEAANTLGISVDEVNSLMSDTGDAANSSISAVEALKESMDALDAEYEAAKETVASTLDSVISGWDAVPPAVAVSAEQVIANLQSQMDWMTSYRENLDALMSREIPGVDMSALITSLSDGSTESAAILAGLKTATDDQVAQIAQSMGGISAGKQTFIDEVGAAQINYDERMAEMVNTTVEAVKEMDLGDDAKKSAANTINGYINGVRSKSGSLNLTMTRAAQNALNAWKRVFDEHSPSKEMQRSGANAMQGEIIGVESKQSEVAKAFSAAGANMMKSLEVGLSNSKGKVMSTVDDVASELKTRLDDLTDGISAKLDINELQQKLWALQNDGASPLVMENFQRSMLSNQIELQEEDLQLKTDAYRKMVQLTGEDSEESLSLYKQLIQARIDLEKYRDELDAVNNPEQADSDDMAKLAEQKYKLWYAEHENATDTEKLAAWAGALSEKYKLQEVSISDTEKALMEMVAAQGETSEGSVKLQEQLFKEKMALIDLKKEISEVGDAYAQWGVGNMPNLKVSTDLSSLRSASAGASETNTGAMLAQAVNAISSMAGSGSRLITVETPIYLNDREVARAITPAIREYEKSSPEVRSDKR